MDAGTGQPVTELLLAAGRGDAVAHEKLWVVVYEELRWVARGQMAREGAGRTLQPTALVHEAYFRLFGDGHGEFANRRHFFAAAANAMRRIRIDDARKRNRVKRGEGIRPRPMAGGSDSDGTRFEDWPAVFDDDPADVLAVDEALERLALEHPRKAEVVTYRYFAGLSARETAEAMGLSVRTVDLDWRFARAWLHRVLS